MSSINYPKRLIEVDLPIKEISAHARREKSIRHGHISTLHIWWARRPLAACRAVLCASLWPDPVDENCPHEFREHAANTLIAFAANVRTNKNLAELCQKGWTRWKRTSAQTLNPNNPGHWGEIRYALLDFIADFANWDASTISEFLETSRSLTQKAHEALGGIPGTKPLVVDPFAGGGSIPLEALRVGADAFGSDLNPVAVLLNKVVLEYIPKYGQQLADEVRKWGKIINEQSMEELKDFYPKEPNGSIPVAYIWARTIKCEGPSCGAEVPLLRSLWLSQKVNNSYALKMIPNHNEKCVDFQIIKNAKSTDIEEGTVQRSSCTCPLCGFTTSAENVRNQFVSRNGGADDAKLIVVVFQKLGSNAKSYRLSTSLDRTAYDYAKNELEKRDADIPTEELPYLRSIFNVNLIGINQWHKLFSARTKTP